MDFGCIVDVLLLVVTIVVVVVAGGGGCVGMGGGIGSASEFRFEFKGDDSLELFILGL